ncbi:hypothetical protein ACHQM5_030557 [Ranunculus cassubicifolius]
MEIITPVVGGVMGGICTPNCINTSAVEICKQVINPTKEFAQLEKMKEKLVAQVADLKMNLCTEELEQGKLCKSVTNNWLKDVKAILDETEAIQKEVERAKRCINRVLPNCCSRSNLGQRIPDLIKEASILSDYGGKLSDGPLALYVPDIGMELPATEVVGKTTAQKTMEKVWECLTDDENGMIGVYGMGGIGKTTIMKNIHNRLLEQTQLFDKIIWITVSKDAHVQNIQHDIAKHVKLDLSEEEDETKRASLLLRELNKRKRIVIILDDMWEVIPLDKIGIPDFTKGKGGKLALTTRSLEVSKGMGCKKDIEVELLSKDEGWELFIKTVGEKLLPQVEEVAMSVAEECSELPLAIITVGGAMRGKYDIQEWRVALKELQESTNLILDMEGKVIERLKFSYNRLDNDIFKSCYLYCALYPEDFQIENEELIDHWVMDGLIDQSSIEDELDLGHVILKKLKSCCMLQGITEYDDYGLSKEYVRMHDLMRDMALNVTKMNPRFLVKAGVQLKRLRDEKLWGEEVPVKVSFMKCDINEIVISPKCKGLITLLLNRNLLQNIAHGFFQQMQGLQVLNLSDNTQIQSLPESVSDLVNLRVLVLSGCWKLKSMPSLEKLLALKVLKLNNTSIQELPGGIEALVNLERLNLTATKLKEFPASLISKFCSLKELHMLPLLIPLKFVDELLSLIHLKDLSIAFRDLSELVYYIGSEEFTHLDYFSFELRDLLLWEYHPRRGRSVSIRNDSSQNWGNSLLLPSNTEFLHLITFNELTRLTELVCLKTVRKLRKCWIDDCSDMEYISFGEEEEGNLLQHMEHLQIEECPSLLSLYKGVASPGTLLRLKMLHISNCDSLKNLFSFTLLKQLRNLVELKIKGCSDFEELVTVSSDEMVELEGQGISSSVKKLWLADLPKLKTLFSKRMLHYFQNLEEVKLADSPRTEEFIVEDVTSNSKTIILPMLKTLELVKLRRLKSIWKGELVCDSLQSVIILSCDELKTLPQFRGHNQIPPKSLKEIKGSIQWWESVQCDTTLWILLNI